MFRHALRRCATLGSPALAPGLRTQLNGRNALQRTSPSALSVIAASQSHVGRRYSSMAAEAASQEQVSEENTSGLITKFADMTRLGVHQKLVDSITRGMKYETMTDVQSKTINAALQGKDMVAQAKTGTGKTLAFLVPLLQRMIQEDPRLAHVNDRYFARPDDIRGIVLSPTRELAEQIAVEAKKLVRGTGLVVQLAVGGTRKSEMLQRTQREGCHLLVATPGRLNDLLEDPSSGIRAPNLAALVLDEADRMLDVGFAAELESIMDKLPDPRTKTRQTMLFSATIPRDVVDLARSMVRPNQFEFVQTIAPDEVLTHEKVPQHIVPVGNMCNVFPTLHELIDREIAKSKSDPNTMPFKAIIFHSTTAFTQLGGMIAAKLLRGRDQPPVYSIHSKLTQQQRTRVSNAFRNAESAILISSDVTARGLDFPNVSHVIQVGAPPDRDQYIHRLGRTGRQDKAGQGWIIVSPNALSQCRRLLGGLPIKVHKSLRSAHFEGDSSSPDAPAQFRNVNMTYKSIPGDVLSNAYLASFGRLAGSKQQLVDELNEWVSRGWGWERPPYISPSSAEKRGLGSVRGINTTHRDEHYGNTPFDNAFGGRGPKQFGGDRFGSDRFGGRRGDGGRFGGSRDRFGGGRARGSGRDQRGWGNSSENYGSASF